MITASVKERLDRLAQERGLAKAVFLQRFRNFDVYSPDFGDLETGLPIFFVVKNNQISVIEGEQALDFMDILDDSSGEDTTPRSMTFDAAPSQRRVDENGFMHVDSCHVTKEQVVKYYGREIPGWRELGLDPERLYNVFRPGDEIEKAAATFDGLPLQLQHHIDSADEPQTEFRVGSISRPVWRAPYLDCDLHITNGAAISAVEHGDFKEISAAYLYEPVIESGEFDGTPYEIVMRNLRGNHVALVPKGRAGADVVVADEAPDAPPLRSFAAWMRKNPLSLKDAPSPEWEATRNALDNN